MNNIQLIFDGVRARTLFPGFDPSKTQILQRGVFDAFTEGNQEWIVLKDAYFWSHRLKCMIKVPSCFITDFASIPRIARFLFTGQGKTRYPALPHDILYAFSQSEMVGFTRKEADLILKDMCKAVGMSDARRKAVYYAVRVGGLKAWNSSKKIQFATPDVLDTYRGYHPELFA